VLHWQLLISLISDDTCCCCVCQTSEIVNAKVSGKLCEMYHLYVNEMSKLVRLLLMLASRLARADNALVSMKHDCNNYKVIVHTSLQFLPFISMLSSNMGDVVALSVGRRTCDL